MNRMDGNFLDFENSCLAVKMPLFAEVVTSKKWICKDRVLWELDWCQRYPEDTFVFLDPWDTLCVGEPFEVEEILKDGKILFPADRYCWPIKEMKEKYDKVRKAISPWCYLNGAGPAGKGKQIAEAITWGLQKYKFVEPPHTDASFWTYVYLYGGFGSLDQRCRLTHQLYGAQEGELHIRKGRVMNSITGTYPQFIHASGHTWGEIPDELIPRRREVRL
jgi:hypothetical protein